MKRPFLEEKPAPNYKKKRRLFSNAELSEKKQKSQLKRARKIFGTSEEIDNQDLEKPFTLKDFKSSIENPRKNIDEMKKRSATSLPEQHVKSVLGRVVIDPDEPVMSDTDSDAERMERRAEEQKLKSEPFFEVADENNDNIIEDKVEEISVKEVKEVDALTQKDGQWEQEEKQSKPQLTQSKITDFFKQAPDLKSANGYIKNDDDADFIIRDDKLEEHLGKEKYAISEEDQARKEMMSRLRPRSGRNL